MALGDAAMLVEFSDTLDLATNALVQRLAHALRARQVPWIRDIVPALASMAIHFDPDSVSALEADPLVRRLVDSCLDGALPPAEDLQRTVEVPICYEPSFALDLIAICERLHLAPEEMIRCHAACDFRVLMVGFAPGHPYLGGLDARLAVPRRATPRPRVPRGSVAIANAQCVVYPYEIPGGWNVIGRTPLRVFDAGRATPSLFAPADKVRFVPIDREQYDAIAAREGTTSAAGPGAERSAARGGHTSAAAAQNGQPGVLVERPGLFTTVQDLGRWGWQHLGIVPGGAMDGPSLRLANALVGNPPGAAALEITLRGPSLQFDADLLIALAGAEFVAKVVARGQATPLPANRPVLLRGGSRVVIDQVTHGSRGYLAVSGGFALAPVLGSRATYVPAGFGGFSGRPLKSGDRLPLDPGAGEFAARRFASLAKRGEKLVVRDAFSTVRWWVRAASLPDAEVTTVRCTDGRHRMLFTEAAHAAFESAVFRIAPDSNRMGYRMQGATLARKIDGDVLSEPTCLGTVQVPADGLPIVLMSDHQTTGGYAKIAEVALADIARLAQLAPGAQVRFSRCTLEQAVATDRAARAALARLEQTIGWQFGHEPVARI